MHICFAILYLFIDFHLFWVICSNCELSSLLIIFSKHCIISASDSSTQAPNLANSFTFSLAKILLWPRTQIIDSWPACEHKAFLRLLTTVELVYGDDKASNAAWLSVCYDIFLYLPWLFNRTPQACCISSTSALKMLTEFGRRRERDTYQDPQILSCFKLYMPLIHIFSIPHTYILIYLFIP